VRIEGQVGGGLVWETKAKWPIFMLLERGRRETDAGRHREGVKAIPLDSPRWLAVPLARDLLHGYKREVEGRS
jgi:hypothetical protein